MTFSNDHLNYFKVSDHKSTSSIFKEKRQKSYIISLILENRAKTTIVYLAKLGLNKQQVIAQGQNCGKPTNEEDTTPQHKGSLCGITQRYKNALTGGRKKCMTKDHNVARILYDDALIRDNTTSIVIVGPKPGLDFHP